MEEQQPLLGGQGQREGVDRDLEGNVEAAAEAQPTWRERTAVYLESQRLHKTVIALVRTLSKFLLFLPFTARRHVKKTDFDRRDLRPRRPRVHIPI